MRTDAGWRERMVGFQGENFVPCAGPASTDPSIPPALGRCPPGTIIETASAGIVVASDLAGRIACQGGGALIIDYGYEGPAAGDTLQAVKGHGYADVFDTVGEADLSAHVDFAALAGAVRDSGAQVFGPIEQGALLNALGIRARADDLKRINPSRVAALEADEIGRAACRERVCAYV